MLSMLLIILLLLLMILDNFRQGKNFFIRVLNLEHLRKLIWAILIIVFSVSFKIQKGINEKRIF